MSRRNSISDILSFVTLSRISKSMGRKLIRIPKKYQTPDKVCECCGEVLEEGIGPVVSVPMTDAERKKAGLGPDMRRATLNALLANDKKALDKISYDVFGRNRK